MQRHELLPGGQPKVDVTHQSGQRRCPVFQRAGGRPCNMRFFMPHRFQYSYNATIFRKDDAERSSKPRRQNRHQAVTSPGIVAVRVIVGKSIHRMKRRADSVIVHVSAFFAQTRQNKRWSAA